MQASRNTHQVLTGTLRSFLIGSFVLETDDGGLWRLDIGWGWRARKLVGQRVTVVGFRADFDLFDVYHLRAV